MNSEKPLVSGAVVVEHLLVGGVVAAGQNNALGRREQVVRPVGILADGAVTAPDSSVASCLQGML